MKILVLNSGSSSIKFQLFEMPGNHVLAAGVLEQIGEPAGHAKVQAAGKIFEETLAIADHHQGLETLELMLKKSGTISDLQDLDAVGHRVVHGGEAFHEPTLIDDRVITAIEALNPLAPLHNPANLEGIQTMRQKAPDLKQVAVFDTAFHQTMPKSAYLYALPHELYEKHHIRRYGFHGTSHYFVAKKTASYLNQPLDQLNIITLHLGNGASASAIREGKSIDTSMGMTPLEGLVMGTRSGDIDPGILFFLARQNNLQIQDLDTLLNKKSGLKGLCGVNDMREIISLAEKGDTQAGLALDIFCYRIKKYIGAYTAVLGRLDALVFTGGIGEHNAKIRRMICEGLQILGLEIDQNGKSEDKGVREISSQNSMVKTLVIATNEELEIASQTFELLNLAS